jgi:sensor histidine kinase YesM
MVDNQNIGLRNSDRRIKLYYGERYGLTIESQLGAGTCVRVVVPFSIAGKPLGNVDCRGDGSCTG